MPKKPIFAIVNDLHLEEGNIENRIPLFSQIIRVLNDLGISDLMILGDVFDSRKAIPENVLNCFGDILTELNNNGVKTYCIPGNHDKLVYSKRDSYLTPFEHYPSFELFQDNKLMEFGQKTIMFSPFYREDIWLSKFNSFVEDNRDKLKDAILLSHIAVTGSKNNNGEEVVNGITRDLFDPFKMTFLGHYHNFHKVGDKIFHCPSIAPKNFGEDPFKGITIVYDDYSYEVRNLQFKEYKNIEIDVDILTNKQIADIIKNASSDLTNNEVKIRFVGLEASVRAVDKDILKRSGFKVETRIKEIEDSIVYSESEEIKEYDEVSIKEAFVEFCEQEKLNHKEGINYLIEK